MITMIVKINRITVTIIISSLGSASFNQYSNQLGTFSWNLTVKAILYATLNFPSLFKVKEPNATAKSLHAISAHSVFIADTMNSLSTPSQLFQPSTAFFLSSIQFLLITIHAEYD